MERAPTQGAAAKATGVTGILYDFGKLGFGQLGSQAIGAAVIIFVMGGFAFAFFKIQNKFMKGGIRPTAEVETQGMDLPEMGVLAYDNLVVNEIDARRRGRHEGACCRSRRVSGSDHRSVARAAKLGSRQGPAEHIALPALARELDNRTSNLRIGDFCGTDQPRPTASPSHSMASRFVTVCLSVVLAALALGGDRYCR